MKKIQYETHVQTGILLNANERSVPLPEKILDEIRDVLDTVAFHRYPDSSQKELLEAYGEAMGIRPECLLAGNGSDQILGYLIGTFLSEGKTLYTLDPDFSMYDYYADGCGASAAKYPFSLEEGGNAEGFIAYGKTLDPDMILFSNPNNPSGICLPLSDIVRILEEFPDIPVVIDEAYIEFASEESAVKLIGAYGNLYVTRTLSKAFGLAGLRTGFLVTSESNCAPLKKAYIPYALNSFSMKAASAVLKYAEEILAEAREVSKRREDFYRKAQSLTKIRLYPSQANFLYGTTPYKKQMLELFEKAGITIRNYAGKDAFRITVGTEEEMEAVWNVLWDLEEKV